jgi:hypothetical protein
MEDIPYDDRDCSSDYRLDWRSYVLSAWDCHRYRECSPKPKFHCITNLQNVFRLQRFFHGVYAATAVS